MIWFRGIIVSLSLIPGGRPALRVTRILFSSYSGLFGGAERILLDCAAAVDGNHLLACPEGDLAWQARAAGLTVLVLPERGLRLRGGLRNPALATAGLIAHGRELRRLSRDLDPELLVGWGMRSALAGLAVNRRTPLAFNHHDFLPGKVIAAGVRLAASRAAVVTAVSHAVAAELDPEGRLGERLRVVHPGVEPESFAGLDPPPDRPAVLLLGAIASWKRPQLALEICALARLELPDLTLRVVGAPVTGDEPLQDSLRHRAAAADLRGSVEFPGLQTDVRAELNRASCLLHCADREPFGIVMLEALAAGRPVLAPDQAGPREIVDSSCGELYPVGDARTAADALVRLLSSRGRAAAMGAAGRALVRSSFDRRSTRRAFAEVLRPVLRDRRRADSSLAATELSLVTVTHNSASELERLIYSVRRHLPGASLIVVDCDSDDDSLAVAGQRPGVRAIGLGQNVGFGRACNRGLLEVSTPVTALINPDVELIDDSLLALAAEALRPGAPERLLTPLVLNRDGTRQQTAHPVPSAAADLLTALVPPAVLPGALGAALAPWRATRPRRVGWAVGAALVARTDTLVRLGPFDESIFMYGEDLELGLRAAADGVPTWFWPQARVLHTGAHAAKPAFGGEPFERLARARHDTVARRLGQRRAGLDDRAQLVTFTSRAALKRGLGRDAERERRQLAALRSVRRG